MIDHCHDYAESAKAPGRPVVDIMCEFTPRESILATGAVPVCLCGGSAAIIPAAEQVLPANL
jgi:benzoyl-CoA reductase/2-hydroxyglutaryl-CoA dehydratase subunit BcrC/BadD/HgdB